MGDFKQSVTKNSKGFIAMGKEGVFIGWWGLLGEDCFTPVTEHRFHDKRRFRFDVAFVDERVAIEIDGGVWSGGRHTRGKGFTSDCEKINLAIECGWVVLRYTPQMLDNDPAGCIQQVVNVLELINDLRAV